MDHLVDQLTVDELIEFHEVCSKLMRHQIIESGTDWLLILDNDIGLDRIFKWSTFIGKAIGEDFRDKSFKLKARDLSASIQLRFSNIGFDISLWSPVFFYLGMIYSFIKHIGFIKIHYRETSEKLEVLSRFDQEFADTIRDVPDKPYLFVDSRNQEPIQIAKFLITSGLLTIIQIDFYIDSSDDLPQEFDRIQFNVIHQIQPISGTIKTNYRIHSFWNDIQNDD